MPKVMVIDDDPGLRLALRLRLAAAGFEVLAAEHPTCALEPVLRARPDLIVLDIDMPHFSGLDFHQCLRGTRRGRDIPVVYLSGAGTPANREDAFRQGARAFISKPFDADELVATLRGLVRFADHAAAP